MTKETLDALQEIKDRFAKLSRDEGCVGMAWLNLAWWKVDEYISEQLGDSRQAKEIVAEKLAYCRKEASHKA